MKFKDKLLNTLRDLVPILEDTIIIGSEVPNLLQFEKKSNLFVSQDIDIGIPIEKYDKVEKKIDKIFDNYLLSSSEPSILKPKTNERLEINFVGIDYGIETLSDIYIHKREKLSFLVFGTLSLISPQKHSIAGIEFSLAEPSGLFVEKIITERSSLKGERDLIVAALLLEDIDWQKDKDFILKKIKALDEELQYYAQDNLATLILLLGKGKYKINLVIPRLKSLLADLGGLP